MTSRLIIGDVRQALAGLPDGSVDLIVTSPPFLALRSYLPADHPDKALEIGSEATPAEFLDVLLSLTAEWRRVLTPHGSIAVELGDTYAGSGGAGGDYNAGGLRDGQGKFDGTAARLRTRKRTDGGQYGNHQAAGTEYNEAVDRPIKGSAGWPLDKCLTFIPELYGVALAYGINPLTGAESPAGRWRVRNKVAWCRPNPPVGALGDKFRPGTSYITVATVARDRWFDLEELRTPTDRFDVGGVSAGRLGPDGEQERHVAGSNPAGAPPLDWWNIPTQPYKGAHYATFPEELPRRLVLAMCPSWVCRECGKPRRRIVETTPSPHLESARALSREHNLNGPLPGPRYTSESTTLGWTDCGHDNYRPGIVLDPFCGTFTTGCVAQGLGRDSIGIDLDSRNADLARQRVGMFLSVEDLRDDARQTPGGARASA